MFHTCDTRPEFFGKSGSSRLTGGTDLTVVSNVSFILLSALIFVSLISTSLLISKIFTAYADDYN